MAKAKSTSREQNVVFLVIIALVVGVIVGAFVVQKPVQTGSDASTGQEAVNAYMDKIVQDAESTGTLPGGAATPQGFRQCMRECREEGHSDTICFFACLGSR